MAKQIEVFAVAMHDEGVGSPAPHALDVDVWLANPDNRRMANCSWRRPRRRRMQCELSWPSRQRRQSSCSRP